MTVIVGYRPSREGEAAFETGLREAALRGERLVVLNSPRLGAPVDASLTTDAQSHELEERARAAQVEMELRHSPHDDDVSGVLLNVAHEVDASIVVIGMRRRTAVGKLLMGSVAQRILIDSDLPVLAVKPDRI